MILIFTRHLHVFSRSCRFKASNPGVPACLPAKRGHQGGDNVQGQTWDGPGQGQQGKGAVQSCRTLTHVFGCLEVDNDQLPSSLLGDEWEVPAGFDLQRGPKGDREIGFPAGRRRNAEPGHGWVGRGCSPLSRVSVPAGFVCQRQVTVGQGILPVQDRVP